MKAYIATGLGIILMIIVLAYSLAPIFITNNNLPYISNIVTSTVVLAGFILAAYGAITIADKKN